MLSQSVTTFEDPENKKFQYSKSCELSLNLLYNQPIMRKLSLGILFGLLRLSGFAQEFNVDSLKNALAHSKNDTSTINTLNKIARAYIYNHPDSAYYYGYRSQQKAKEIHFLKGEAGGQIMMGDGLTKMGDYAAALTALISGLKLAEQARGETTSHSKPDLQ
jgi:hypothetical protein